jgi:hypothetical protein
MFSKLQLRIKGGQEREIDVTGRFADRAAAAALPTL